MVFRDMRRGRQALNEDEITAVLLRNTHGVLACLGDDEYPYAVPLSYVYYQGRLYFHCATSGHKVDAITVNPKVSFAVVDEDTVVSAEYTSYYRSVIVFGKARKVAGDERQETLRALIEKYCADQPNDRKRAMMERCEQMLIVAIDIEHRSGKEAKQYAAMKTVAPHPPATVL
jgi:nitroimidazol reductase NimA-like FMN-containing flavoprotein (pyridoxamine 5'-phosphate oxidase superfamily)